MKIKAYWIFHYVIMMMRILQLILTYTVVIKPVQIYFVKRILSWEIRFLMLAVVQSVC